MLYNIESDNSIKDQLIVAESFMKGSSAFKKSRINIKVAGKAAEVELIRSKKLEIDKLVLSENVIKELMIPDKVQYQIRVEKGSIRIGPIIGLLMTSERSRMSKSTLTKLLNYTLIYPEIGGLLVAFSTDIIDFENKSVEGYYYDSNFVGRGLPWVAGTFPIPESIFSRTMLSDDIMGQLQEETNNKLFNSNFFNKWEFWKKISKSKRAVQYLPKTSLYLDFKNLEDVVDKYGAAYLKPLNGTLSRGLYKVSKLEEGYGLQPKQGEDMIKFSTAEETAAYIKDEIVRNYKYIVQQAINPLRVKGRHMDFRVIMQKNETLDWQCTGIIALIGSRGDICSNWGSTAYFEDIFYDEFNLTQKEIFKIKREIIGACVSICKALESQKENYGDLGFDVVVDEDYKIWILEANKRHYHTVPLWINDVQTFYQTKANPIKYAAAQVGFRVYS
ncbi:MAG: YheC/YheD family protein [Clostridia bacterium]|jgi:hypothetical protein|nr:YheC/YheD family protein [Clostridia bacterium]